MVTTLCISGAVLNKAGENVSTTINGDPAVLDQFINQAEGYINCVTRHNWIDDFSGLNTDVKLILEEVCSNLAAIYVIMYDMFGYSSLDEAEVMINVLLTRSQQGLALLKDQKVKDFISGA